VQISISTRHGHLSDATQDKLKAKAGKLVRYFERLTSIELTIDLKDQQSPKVDIKLSAEHKHDFVAHGNADNLLGATDEAVQKVEKQLRKYKKQVQQRHRNQEGRRYEVVPETSPEAVVDPELN
jgi:ribosome hibernation promoting factor